MCCTSGGGATAEQRATHAQARWYSSQSQPVPTHRPNSHEVLYGRRLSTKVLGYNMLGVDDPNSGTGYPDAAKQIAKTLFFPLYLWAITEDNTRVQGLTVPDTLLVHHGRIHSWIFTDREGVIRRKKKIHSTGPEILRAFSKLTAAKQSTAPVAYHIVPRAATGGGMITPYTLSELTALIGMDDTPSALPDGLLQANIVGYMDHDSMDITTVHYTFMDEAAGAAKHNGSGVHRRAFSLSTRTTPGTKTALGDFSSKHFASPEFPDRQSFCRVETFVKNRSPLSLSEATPEVLVADRYATDAQFATNVVTPARLEERVTAACNHIAEHIEGVAPSFYHIEHMTLHFSQCSSGKLYILWCSDISAVANGEGSSRVPQATADLAVGKLSTVKSALKHAKYLPRAVVDTRPLHFAADDDPEDSEDDITSLPRVQSETSVFSNNGSPENARRTVLGRMHDNRQIKKTRSIPRTPGDLPLYPRAPRSRVSIQRPGSKLESADQEVAPAYGVRATVRSRTASPKLPEISRSTSRLSRSPSKSPTSVWE